jgi:hypothetical protein
MEFGNGKVIRETQYFRDPFEAPGAARKMGGCAIPLGMNQSLAGP